METFFLKLSWSDLHYGVANGIQFHQVESSQCWGAGLHNVVVYSLCACAVRVQTPFDCLLGAGRFFCSTFPVGGLWLLWLITYGNHKLHPSSKDSLQPARHIQTVVYSSLQGHAEDVTLLTLWPSM